MSVRTQYFGKVSEKQQQNIVKLFLPFSRRFVHFVFEVIVDNVFLKPNFNYMMHWQYFHSGCFSRNFQGEHSQQPSFKCMLIRHCFWLGVSWLFTWCLFLTENNTVSNALLAHYNLKSHMGHYLNLFFEPEYSRPRSIEKWTTKQCNHIKF